MIFQLKPKITGEKHSFRYSNSEIFEILLKFKNAAKKFKTTFNSHVIKKACISYFLDMEFS